MPAPDPIHQGTGMLLGVFSQRAGLTHKLFLGHNNTLMTYELPQGFMAIAALGIRAKPTGWFFYIVGEEKEEPDGKAFPDKEMKGGHYDTSKERRHGKGALYRQA